MTHNYQQLVPATVRDNIIKCCGNHLGVYTYLNGFSIVAISVGNPENELKVQGVEVIIPWFPKVRKNNRTGQFVYREECWDIMLLQHSGCNLYTVVDLLTRYFVHSSGTYIGRTNPVSTVEMYMFSIKHCDLYNATDIPLTPPQDLDYVPFDVVVDRIQMYFVAVGNNE